MKSTDIVFIVDSGAGHHTCRDASMLVNPQPISPPQELRSADGGIMKATARGDVQLRLKAQDKVRDWQLSKLIIIN